VNFGLPNQLFRQLTVWTKSSTINYEIVEKWDCADNIVNIVLDTTASNTSYQQLHVVRVYKKNLDKHFCGQVVTHYAGEILLTANSDVRTETLSIKIT